MLGQCLGDVDVDGDVKLTESSVKRWISGIGQLDETTRTELEAHLPLCEGCDEYLRQMRTTIQALGHVPLDSLSETAQADLLAAFRDFPVRP